MIKLPFFEHDLFCSFFAENLENVCQLLPAAPIGDPPFFEVAFSGAGRTDDLLETILWC
jgi:hypothetical protein